MSRTIIPALPGYFIASFIEANTDYEADEFSLTPIIAWVIDLDLSEKGTLTGSPMPIGACFGVIDDRSYIKCPDGQFFRGDDQMDNEAIALANARRSK
ncbi:hypothetical protein [Bradyrhizobium genosp. P]|uniref:hypothetical protein n=1 Tax=Bradyrhizobium genosp. P TaxID=83641 RepID=UPI003CE96279